MNPPEAQSALLAFLESKKPILLDEDHPELADGSGPWVRKLRAESEARFARIFADR
jgi:hypothetical protein